MAQDATIDIRAEPDPDAPRTIPCDLSRNAAYHPWNQTRVEARGLQFLTFFKMEHYVVNEDYRATGRLDSDRPEEGKEFPLDFKHGDRFEDLAYGYEGYFLMRFNGTLYVAFQDLIDASTAIDKMRDYGTRADEWLRLTCDNGSVGWLRLNDIDDAPGFAYLALTEDKTD